MAFPAWGNPMQADENRAAATTERGGTQEWVMRQSDLTG